MKDDTSTKRKAIYLDRDGTLIKLVYDQITNHIDSVSKKEEVEITYDFPEVLKKLKQLGYLLIIISNQPRIGLKKETKENFEEIHQEMVKQLENERIKLDKIYYCFHHPFAEVEEYRIKCECRKPGIKFFKDAENEFKIDLSKSYMIGDSANDVKAGYAAGVKTILFANIEEAAYLELLEKQLGSIKPDYLIKEPKQILEIIND